MDINADKKILTPNQTNQPTKTHFLSDTNFIDEINELKDSISAENISETLPEQDFAEQPQVDSLLSSVVNEFQQKNNNFKIIKKDDTKTIPTEPKNEPINEQISETPLQKIEAEPQAVKTYETEIQPIKTEQDSETTLPKIETEPQILQISDDKIQPIKSEQIILPENKPIKTEQITLPEKEEIKQIEAEQINLQKNDVETLIAKNSESKIQPIKTEQITLPEKEEIHPIKSERITLPENDNVRPIKAEQLVLDFCETEGITDEIQPAEKEIPHAETEITLIKNEIAQIENKIAATENTEPEFKPDTSQKAAISENTSPKVTDLEEEIKPKAVEYKEETPEKILIQDESVGEIHKDYQEKPAVEILPEQDKIPEQIISEPKTIIEPKANEPEVIKNILSEPVSAEIKEPEQIKPAYDINIIDKTINQPEINVINLPKNKPADDIEIIDKAINQPEILETIQKKPQIKEVKPTSESEILPINIEKQEPIKAEIKNDIPKKPITSDEFIQIIEDKTDVKTETKKIQPANIISSDNTEEIASVEKIPPASLISDIEEITSIIEQNTTNINNRKETEILIPNEIKEEKVEEPKPERIIPELTAEIKPETKAEKKTSVIKDEVNEEKISVISEPKTEIIKNEINEPILEKSDIPVEKSVIKPLPEIKTDIKQPKTAELKTEIKSDIEHSGIPETKVKDGIEQLEISEPKTEIKIEKVQKTVLPEKPKQIPVQETIIPVQNQISEEIEPAKISDEKVIEKPEKIIKNKPETNILQKEDNRADKVNMTSKPADKRTEKEETVSENNIINTQPIKEEVKPQVQTNLSFGTGQESFESILGKTNEIKESDKELEEDLAILSTDEENIAIAAANNSNIQPVSGAIQVTDPNLKLASGVDPMSQLIADTNKQMQISRTIMQRVETKTNFKPNNEVTYSEVVTETEEVVSDDTKPVVETKTETHVEHKTVTKEKVVKVKTEAMPQKDVNFMLSLTKTDSINLADTLLNQSQETAQNPNISNKLIELIKKAMSENKPLRLDFDNKISVIIKISKEGKISADFIPGDKAVENYLRNNIPFLKQQFDAQNIKYDDITHQNSRQQKDKDNTKNKKEQKNE